MSQQCCERATVQVGARSGARSRSQIACWGRDVGAGPPQGAGGSVTVLGLSPHSRGSTLITSHAPLPPNAVASGLGCPHTVLGGTHVQTTASSKSVWSSGFPGNRRWDEPEAEWTPTQTPFSGPVPCALSLSTRNTDWHGSQVSPSWENRQWQKWGLVQKHPAYPSWTAAAQSRLWWGTKGQLPGLGVNPGCSSHPESPCAQAPAEVTPVRSFRPPCPAPLGPLPGAVPTQHSLLVTASPRRPPLGHPS